MAKAAKKTTKKTAKKAPSPNQPMTKSEVQAYMADKVGITKQQAKQFFEEQANLAYIQAKKNDKGFTIPGIGKLVVAKRAPRTMTMQFGPKKGQQVKVPAKKTPKFRVSKQAKDALVPGGK